MYRHPWSGMEKACFAEATMACRRGKHALPSFDTLPKGISVLAVHRLVASWVFRTKYPLEVQDTLGL